MSLQTAVDELVAVLTADAGLIAWADKHFRKTITVLKSNREVTAIEPKDMPALIIELGDGASEIAVANHQQDNSVQALISFGWYEQDNDTAFDQRTELADLVIKALMANHTLNSKVGGAWVSGFNSDKNVYHPKHFMRFSVPIEYPVYND